MNATLRSYGINYSRFIYGLNRSNVVLDRKILSDLAINEPYSFKAVLNEVNTQTDLKQFAMVDSKISKLKSMSYTDALQKGYLREGPAPTKEEALEIEKMLIEPKQKLYGLRFPERDAKTDADYMRISFKEEDEAFLKDQQRQTLTMKEMKK